MTFLIWLYAIIGAIYLGVLGIGTIGKRRTPLALLMFIGFSVAWPYAFYLVYRQGRKE